MRKIEIKDVDSENVEDLINLCIPSDNRDDYLFIEGARVKKRWATQMMKRYGVFSKLAYIELEPVGMIQYQPKQEKVIEITCIFVPEKKNLRKGIGRALLRALIDEMHRLKSYFNNEYPSALVTWAFQVPGTYPQHEFYQKMGFKHMRGDDPFLLYHPLKEGYIYAPKGKKYIPQEEDKGKALIFYDPSCPFCIYFTEKIKESIREIAPEIPIRVINQFEEEEKVRKRGKVSFCIVNQRFIEPFFVDKENFQKEVMEAVKT